MAMPTTMTLSTPRLDTLPLELQQLTLSHLSLSTLLTFARTSKHNNQLSTSSLTTLKLAVFTKRVHGILALLNTSPTFIDDPSLHQIAIPTTTSQRPSKSRLGSTITASPAPQNTIARAHKNTTAQQARHASIHAQNALLASLLHTPTLHALKFLHIATTAILSPQLTSILATSFPHLRHLSLDFSHPYIHEPCLPAKYWTTVPRTSDEGTPAWNCLAGIGEENEERLSVRGLETLEVRRGGMTGRQGLEMVRRNRKGLRELRLATVTGVDKEFVEGLAELGKDEGSVGLRVLELEGCTNLVLNDDEDFEWIEKMVEMGLEELSLKGCEGVNGERLKTASAAKRWEEGGLRLVLPDDEDVETKSCDGDMGDDLTDGKGATNELEVDPDYV